MVKKITPDERDLLDVALATKKNACLRWGFGVGAAVLAKDGKKYEGCNIETYISGLGVCAERCAIDHAILHGARVQKQGNEYEYIEKIAVVADSGDVSSLVPCGACLQYIYDFSNGKATLITALAKDENIIPGSINAEPISKLLKSHLESRLSERTKFRPQ